MTRHDDFLRLSENGVKALRAAATVEMLSPWDFGAHAVSTLKKLKYVAPVKVNGATRYAITAAGADALAKEYR